MINKQKVLALIPARGGSKGLPRKNILSFSGKPLIAHSIAQANKSKYIDKLIVTTNSQEVANIAIQIGAEVPFLRPEKLAQDDSNATSVILHALDFPSIKELIMKRFSSFLS